MRTFITTNIVPMAVLVLVQASSFAGQQWPADQLPVENSLPQYRPLPRQQNETLFSIPSVTEPTSPAQPMAPPLKNTLEQQPPQDILVANPLAGKFLESTNRPPPSNIPPQLEPKLPGPGVTSRLPQKTPTPSFTYPQPQPTQQRPTFSSQDSVQRNRFSQTPQKQSGPGLSSVGLNSKSKPPKKAKKKPFVIDDAIYRDRSYYPLDSRKPCQPCLTANRYHPERLLGNRGEPYREKVYGGCECDTCRPCARPNVSIHWPRTFSFLLDERFPTKAAQRYAPTEQYRIVDVFNPLSKLKLSSYKRTDNGYRGIGSDPYGCLGETRAAQASYYE